MTIKKSTLAFWFIGYLIAHIPLYLALEYLAPGNGAYVQTGNFALLILVLCFVKGVHVGFAEKTGSILIILAVASLSYRAVSFGSFDLAEFQQVAKIALAISAMALTKTCVKRWGMQIQNLRKPLIIGMLGAILSQALGLVYGVTPEDSTYGAGLVGLSSSVSLFSAYLSSIVLILGALLNPGLGRNAVFLVGALQVAGTLRRTAWVSCVAQVLWYVISNRYAVRRIVSVGVVAYIGWMLVPVVVPELAEAMSLRLSALFGGGAVGSGRSDFYAIAGQALVGCDGWDCLFGIGRAETLALMGSQFGAEIGAHSLILDTGLMFGWPAVLILVLFFGAVGVKVVALPRGDLRTLGGMAFMNLTVFGLFSGVGFEPVVIPSFVVIGLVAAGQRKVVG